MIKQYQSIYENYNFDIITPDPIGCEVILHDDPNEDYDDLVHEILITDISSDLALYANLDKIPGGKPRLGAGGGFTESISTRLVSKKGKNEILYYSSKPQDMLAWLDKQPVLIEDTEDAFTEPKLKIRLVVSAKKLKLDKEKEVNLRPEIRKIKKMTKQKLTRGSGF